MPLRVTRFSSFFGLYGGNKLEKSTAVTVSSQSVSKMSNMTLIFSVVRMISGSRAAVMNSP